MSNGSGLKVWRSTQLARTPGMCLICDGLIENGESMAILAYGGKSNDWGRGHLKCATDDPTVLKPDSVKFAGELVIRELPASEPLVDEVDYVELAKGQYKGLDKYAVRHQGKVVWTTSDRRRAEGGVGALQAYLEGSGKK